MKELFSVIHAPLALLALLLATSHRASAAEAVPPPAVTWKIGAPIITYWCGPELTDAVATQMAEGGWNLVWCNEQGLDIAQRHGLRGQVENGLLTAATLDDPKRRGQLDAFIERVRKHPAFYAYHLTDEPGAGQFPALGKLVAYLRERVPAQLADLNVFPTYASNQQLGTQGDTVSAYREHLRQYVGGVKPALLSYDHYQFALAGDNPEYFLNLALIRRAALDAGVPFLNIVQASTWVPKIMRVPGPDEMRYLVYTTLAYGGQGISYYIYTCKDHLGGIAHVDGSPTPLYPALQTLNREFLAIATALQPLRPLGVYHAGMMPPGAEALPKDAAFTLDPSIPAMNYQSPERVQGVLLGVFGPTDKTPADATHAIIVNLDYKKEMTLGLRAAGRLEIFDAKSGRWSASGGPSVELKLAGGSGKLVRVIKKSRP